MEKNVLNYQLLYPLNHNILSVYRLKYKNSANSINSTMNNNSNIHTFLGAAHEALERLGR
jgi:hypothetical protein